MRGSRYPPAPTKKTSVENTLVFVLSDILSFTLEGGFEQLRSRPPPAAETGRRGWGSAPLFQSPAKGLRKKRQAQLVRPAVQSGGQKSPCGAFLDARLAISTRAHQKDQRRKYAGFCFIRYLKFHSRGWIRTAAEPTAACGGNREARLGQRSAFSKPCQGAAEKAASATRKTRRTVRRAKKPLRGFFRCAARDIHPRPPKRPA